MLAQVRSASLVGVEGIPVRVEAQVATGIPGLFLVGLPRGAAREGRDRVQAALRAIPGISDALRVTLNLAPADVVKEGAGLDLAMALAILAGAGEVSTDRLDGTAFLGELGLDGRLYPVRGILPLVLGCARAGARAVVIPRQDLPAATLAGGHLALLGADSLQEVLGHLRGGRVLSGPGRATEGGEGGSGPSRPEVDLADIRGQSWAKRALEIAAAGGHGLLLTGPPGAGKTLLARALRGLLPPLTSEASLEVTAIHSAAGLLKGTVNRVTDPPFRAPHHGASRGALVGGGSPLRPGEVTLAHRGVLFLDELPHWGSESLNALREPLESGFVDVTRTGRQARFPARFLLVAAMNPCPCGQHGEPEGRCRCDEAQVRRYQGRIPGPLLDRIDLILRLHRTDPEALLAGGGEEATDTVRRRVLAARERARDAGRGTDSAPARGVAGEMALEATARTLLRDAATALRLSARGVTRALRVAGTVALLDHRSRIGEEDIAEALQFRGGDLFVPPSVAVSPSGWIDGSAGATARRLWGTLPRPTFPAP